MPYRCAVPNCNYKSSTNISLFRFPLERENLCKLWVTAIGRENWQPTTHSRVCSLHFEPTDYLNRPGSYLRRLKQDAVPHVFISAARLIPWVEKTSKITETPRNVDLITHNTKTNNSISTSTKETINEELSLFNLNYSSKTEDQHLIEEDSHYLIFPLYNDVATQTECGHICGCINNTDENKCLKRELDDISRKKKLKKKIKTLQQKVRRQTKSINRMKELLQTLNL
ncbi:PREDICTED: THAP domain-containing protein 1-like [Cyphomyrmex costatus]|uniref:THAP domain-containing protein 1-like n=1 Tax=Cyphomyrmex costatus TaxID=456900 RepID=UPI0008524689|nr:PREDICTED: THAP domain-containing protein 1-like [Cyphomyrmex costatus]XP_018399781.1 PREDICTED: THAP domain-containing protein 1-like [Cyphomyrmex costatus]XP_018399782.1 PREDICTED: THAP domain-containing protein 1-like [Cyphomyrmex costatus]